jgi:hypothetical protein
MTPWGVLGVAVQIAAVAAMAVMLGPRRWAAMGFWVALVLVGYHGGTVVSGWLGGVPPLAYAGLRPEMLNATHAVAALQIALFVTGYLVVRRAAGGEIFDPTRKEMVAISVLVIAVISQSLAGGVFFRSTNRADLDPSYLGESAGYLLYTAPCILAIYGLYRPGSVGYRTWLWIAGLFGLALITGRRSGLLVCAVTLTYAMTSLQHVRVRGPLVSRTLVLGLGAVLVFVALPLRSAFERGGVSTTSLRSLLGTYVSGVLEGVTSADPLDQMVDESVAYRLDGHVFLARVVQAQWDGAPALGTDALQDLAAFIVPKTFWPGKADRRPEYIEDRVIAGYRAPKIDYTPTVNGELVAVFGIVPGTVLMTVLGAALALLERVLASNTRLRVLFAATVLQGGVQAELGLLGLAMALRTFVMLWPLVWLLRPAKVVVAHPRQRVGSSRTDPNMPRPPNGGPLIHTQGTR